MPPHSHCSASTREARLAQHGFPVAAPECLGALSDSPAWRASWRTLLGEKARVVGRQLLWGGKGLCTLSCPENNVGA